MFDRQNRETCSCSGPAVSGSCWSSVLRDLRIGSQVIDRQTRATIISKSILDTACMQYVRVSRYTTREDMRHRIVAHSGSKGSASQQQRRRQSDGRKARGTSCKMRARSRLVKAVTVANDRRQKTISSPASLDMAFVLMLLVLVFGGGLFLLLKLLSKGRLKRLKQQFPPDRQYEETRLPCHSASLRSQHIRVYAIAIPVPDTAEASAVPDARDEDPQDVSNVRIRLT